VTKRKSQHGYVGKNYRVFEYADSIDRFDNDERMKRNYINRNKSIRESEIIQKLFKIIDEA
jgi:hypothetical protein